MKIKKILSWTLALAVVFGSVPIAEYRSFFGETSLTASAADYTDVEYESLVIREYATYAEVVGYNQNVRGAENVVIPAEIDGLPVLSIAASTFGKNVADGNSVLKSITIPDSVISIGERAFYRCHALEEIVIPDSVLDFGESVFYECENLKSVKLPEGLTGIPHSTFSGCTSLESVNLPSGITKIDNLAFERCTSIVSVEIPESVTEIGDYAFCESGLTSITISGNVKTIYGGAFANCQNLESAVIEEGVETIESNAFTDCTALKTANIPSTATLNVKFGGTFKNCTSLVSCDIAEDAKYISNNDFGIFESCKSLESIKIPLSFEIVPANICNGCSGLTSVEIPEGITEIEGAAFYECTSLTEVEIPESVKKFGADPLKVRGTVFTNCQKLEKVTFKNKDCEIYSTGECISNYTLNDKIFFTGTIYGYEGSTAQEYAEKYGYKFAVIQDDDTTETVTGDSNGDGQITLADAVAILQYVANPEKYPLSQQGLVNADVYNAGDGVTGMDALAIQMYDSGQIDSLPYNPQ